MFKPRFPQLNWSLYATLSVGGVLACYLAEAPWWSYAVACSAVLASVAWVVRSARNIQLQQHGALKERGLRIAWDGSNLHERMSEQDFVGLFESRMANATWRSDVLALIGGSRWVGVTDHFTNPYTFRWELTGTLPKTWGEDDRGCLYVVCMSCLPAWHPYQLEIDKGQFALKNGAAYTNQIPRVHTDAPAITLQFWNYFQKHMAVLMDTRVEFNAPSFQCGLALAIDIAVPSSFALAEGGSLTAAKEGDTYCVCVVSSTGQAGPTQRYSSANEFWWVWRNAIEHKPLFETP